MGFSHVQERRYAQSRIPQTNYQTPTTPVTTNPLAFVELLAKDQNLVKFTPNTKDNDGFSTGSDFPTEVYLTTWDTEADKEAQLEVDMVGRWLYAAFGAVTTTQPDAGGNPNVYRHTFTPMPAFTGRQLPAYSLVQQIASNPTIDAVFPSMVMQKLTLKGDGVDRLDMAANWRGSGKRLNPSNINFGGGSNHVLVPTRNYLYNSQAVLKVGDYSTVANQVNYSTGCRFRSWEVGIDNALLTDDGYCPGAPLYQYSGVGTAWAATAAVSLNAYVYAGDLLYQVTVAGTTGSTAPSHTSGAVANGTATLKFVASIASSGQVRGECLFGKRNYTMQFVVRLDTATDEYAAIQQQKKLDIIIQATGGVISGSYNYDLKMHVGLAQYQAVEVGNQNGIVTLQITPRILFDSVNNTVMDVVLTNSTSSYTS